eukprot:jgi/Ulvmu1/250/UM001_0254.1
MWNRENGVPSHPGGAHRDPRRNALREDALLGRRASLLSRGTDQNGQPKLFGLFTTFPWHLQKESSLLALHFGSVGLFIILMLFMTLLSIWPLHACLDASEPQQEYRIYYEDANGIFQYEDLCEKLVPVITFAGKMSPGSFCQDQGLASRYDCSAVCHVPASALPDPSGPRGPARGCLPPCFVSDNNEACCDLQEVDEARSDAEHEVPPGFLWLWCVAVPLVFCLWMLALQYLQYGFAEAGNVKNINMAQYAVLLSNVGGVDCDDNALKEFGRRYGDVVAAFHVRNFGRFLAPSLQLQSRRELHAELERIEAEQEPPPTLPGTAPIQLAGRFDSRFSRLMLFIYKRILCWHLPLRRRKQGLENTDDDQQELVLRRSRQPDSGTGNAIIIFDNVASVANMMHEHNWRNRVGSMLFPPGWGRALNVATRGAFARTPKITLTKTQENRVQTTRRHVSVRRAPEPSDIWWENTLYGGWRVVRRRIVAWTLYALLLGIALFVQAQLAIEAKNERDENLRGEDRPDMDSIGPPEAITNALSWKFTNGKLAATLLFSGLGTVLCRIISDLELYLTSTQHMGSMIVKLTVFNLLNGFVVPTLAIAASGDNEGRGIRLWFGPGGLADIALLVQLSNVVIPNVLALFKFEDVVSYHFLSRVACSKVFACKFAMPPPFRIYQRLPGAIYTLGLSILYTPVLPISPLIGAVALCVQYCVDQFLALRHASKPRSFQVEALAAVNYVVRLLPLVLIIFVWALFHEHRVNVAVPAAIGVIIWVIFAIVPALHTARSRHFKNWVEGGRPRLLMWAKEPGYRQPTWTHTKQQTSTMSVVSDVPDGIRFNYDTYLPDCVSLDPKIFTERVKPHFYYHNPPLAQTVPGHAAKLFGVTQRYQQVAPAVEVTRALQSLHTVQPPAAAEQTCSFRPQELKEGPALPGGGGRGSGGWWPLSGLFGRAAISGQLGLGAIEEAEGEPTFVPMEVFDSIGSGAGGGGVGVSETGRQVFVPGGGAAGDDAPAATFVPGQQALGRRNPAYPQAQPTSPGGRDFMLESK